MNRFVFIFQNYIMVTLEKTPLNLVVCIVNTIKWNILVCRVIFLYMVQIKTFSTCEQFYSGHLRAWRNCGHYRECPLYRGFLRRVGRALRLFYTKERPLVRYIGCPRCFAAAADCRFTLVLFSNLGSCKIFLHYPLDGWTVQNLNALIFKTVQNLNALKFRR